MAETFQRVGSVSNAHVGRDFEAIAERVLNEAGISVTANYKVDVGVDQVKKSRSFDLGSDDPAIIVECKSHRWTKGNNIPSAKITVWNESMYYFSCAPTKYRKIFFVLRDARASTSETLSAYYVRINRHLVPAGVEIWEYDETSESAAIVFGAES